MRAVNKNYEEEQELKKLRSKWEIKGNAIGGQQIHFSGFYAKNGIEVGEIYAEREYVILIERPSPKSEVVPQYSGSFVTRNWYEWDGETVRMEFPDTISRAIHEDDMFVLRKAMAIAGDDNFELTVHRLYGARNHVARRAFLLVKRGWMKTERYTYDEEFLTKKWRFEFVRL